MASPRRRDDQSRHRDFFISPTRYRARTLALDPSCVFAEPSAECSPSIRLNSANHEHLCFLELHARRTVRIDLANLAIAVRFESFWRSRRLRPGTARADRVRHRSHSRRAQRLAREDGEAECKVAKAAIDSRYMAVSRPRRRARLDVVAARAWDRAWRSPAHRKGDSPVALSDTAV